MYLSSNARLSVRVFLVGVMVLFLGGCSEKIVNNVPETRVQITARLSSVDEIEQLKYFTLTVTGPDIERPILGVLYQTDGILMGEVRVPIGENRRFIARAYDDRDVIIYSGETTADVTEEQTSNQPIVIILRPQVPLMKFTPRSVAAEIYHTFSVDTRLFKVDSVVAISFRVYFDNSSLRLDSVRLHPDMESLPGAVLLYSEIVDSFPMSYCYMEVAGSGDVTPQQVIVDTAGNANLTTLYFATLGREVTTELTVEPVYIQQLDAFLTNESQEEFVTEKCRVEIGPLINDIPVQFADTLLEAAIRDEINKPSGGIYYTELSAIESLYVHVNWDTVGICDLGGLEYLTNLRFLYLSSNEFSDVHPLSGLINLEKLFMTHGNVSDIWPLAGLVNLQQLDLSDNYIVDIEPLAGMSALQSLTMNRNQITDIGALSGLTQLMEISLESNYVAGIQGLAGLSNLHFVDLWDNQITDLGPLAGLTGLTYLVLDYNQITDITPLSGLTSLENLGLRFNSISNIQPLSGLSGLHILSLNSNDISDIAALSGLTNLTNLYLTGNQISDVQALSGLTSLTNLYLDDNYINDITPLGGLTNMEWLSLPYNSVGDITALTNLINLKQLYLHQNEIEDIYPLVLNTGMDDGDYVNLSGNPLSANSIELHIPELTSRGVTVVYP
jgi:Leucine-rich repeat (LRR) protein